MSGIFSEHVSTERYVVHNGVSMSAHWPDRITQAQREPTYEIGGHEWTRVPLGEEARRWVEDDHVCHDCAVRVGQYHVPGCDAEECPQCSRQALSCDCDY